MGRRHIHGQVLLRINSLALGPMDMYSTTESGTAQADRFDTTAFVATVLAVAGLSAALAVLAWRKLRENSLYVSSQPPVA